MRTAHQFMHSKLTEISCNHRLTAITADLNDITLFSSPGMKTELARWRVQCSSPSTHYESRTRPELEPLDKYRTNVEKNGVQNPTTD